jgi:hypothetical protein
MTNNQATATATATTATTTIKCAETGNFKPSEQFDVVLTQEGEYRDKQGRLIKGDYLLALLRLPFTVEKQWVNDFCDDYVANLWYGQHLLLEDIDLNWSNIREVSPDMFVGCFYNLRRRLIEAYSQIEPIGFDLEV